MIAESSRRAGAKQRCPDGKRAKTDRLERFGRLAVRFKAGALCLSCATRKYQLNEVPPKREPKILPKTEKHDKVQLQTTAVTDRSEEF